MSKERDIILGIRDLLRQNINYVKDVFVGVRESITNFPCLAIEVNRIREEENICGKVELFTDLFIYGFVRESDKDELLIGSGGRKGIVDLLEDVKNALDVDRTIGGEVIHLSIGEARFGVVDYPVRGFELDVSVRYRVNKGGRG